MTGPVVVLDAGVLDKATTNREFRWVLRDLVEAGWTPVVPTVVLAEAITGRPEDAPTNQAVKALGTVDTDPATARIAGALRFVAHHAGGRRVPSGIDAIIAAHAAVAGTGVIFTTDPTDLRRLLANHPGVHVDKP